MKVSPSAIRIAMWLRFERGSPAYLPDIEQALKIKMTPALIQEGEYTGLFRFSNWPLGQGFF